MEYLTTAFRKPIFRPNPAALHDAQNAAGLRLFTPRTSPQSSPFYAHSNDMLRTFICNQAMGLYFEAIC